MKKREFNFSIVAFVAAFAIGMIFVCLSAPPLKYVVVHPTPYNAGTVVYKDRAETCYVFDAAKVDCPKDKTKIKSQPLIE